MPSFKSLNGYRSLTAWRKATATANGWLEFPRYWDKTGDYPSSDLQARNFKRDLDRIFEILDFNPSPNPGDLSWAVQHVTAYSEQYFAHKQFVDAFKERFGVLSGLNVGKASQSKPELATPGSSGELGVDSFRSMWEERVAKALTRLGIPWSYEPERFRYPGKDGYFHTYTPDFRIDCLANTFVEVKGHAGPDAVDTIKMERVLKRYPKLTLLLWDAGTVEYIEDCTDPAIVIGLLNTTRLAA